MKDEIFKESYKHYLSNYTLGEDLESLYKKFDYKDKETFRCDLKDERKRRKLPARGEIQVNLPKTTLEKPRVAVLDVETLPMVCFTWGMYDQNISTEQVLADSCLLSWAGKFLNEVEVFSDILTSKEAIKRDERRIVKSCWDFLSQCDVVIGHNFAGFDNKILNTGFLKYGLPPLKFIIVDTFLVAKQNFRFSSNKMKFINEQLGVRNKVDNDGFPLWRKCHLGDQESLDKMIEYNIGDIPATEELYYKVRPYVRNFNVALYNEIDKYQCPICGGQKFTSIGYYYTSAGKWESVRCDNCGCTSRKKENLLWKDKKKTLLINS